MARWQDDDDSFDTDSFDEDPQEADTDSADTGDWDETPLPDPAGPGLISVVGLWLIFAAPLIFLLPMALTGLARGELEGVSRWLAVAVVLYAVGAIWTLSAYTRRYLAGRNG